MVPRRPLPENLAAIQERLEDEGVEIHEALTDGRLVVRGNVIELIQEPEAIEEHLVFLETLGDDGAAAARNLRSLRPQFLIFARSVLAGRSGCYVIYAGEDCQAYRAFDPRCKDLELEMFRRDSACHAGRPDLAMPRLWLLGRPLFRQMWGGDCWLPKKIGSFIAADGLVASQSSTIDALMVNATVKSRTPCNPMSDVSRILSQIESGDPKAADQLLPLVYDELRRLATAKLGNEKPGQTLQATALVHEAYLRLVGDDGLQWNSRHHFFAAAAEAMRRILVDSARRKASRKHGGDLSRKSMLDSGVAAAAPPNEVIAVHEALDRFRMVDALAAELVMLHYFGGFSLEEAGELLGISRATAYRRWTYARTWLRADLESAKKSDSAADK